ncbi:hypothetical protein UFOVP60_25 [uncultured Caudovirales phage]|uniref:Uncharacterized protein n=1 Tax=uncultured Caudovirales phage TaxID=2100421 RepID=A0A6J5T9B6_9CAUD|nr:hypothetical protein UFOVP60_25 [uncultured Caudovirales phage]
MSINFASAQSAFDAATTALFSVVEGSSDKEERLNKILARIEADAKLVVKVVAGKAAVTDLNLSGQVQPGRKVHFDYGRGDKKRSYEGVVLARRDPAEGEKVAPQCRIQVGEGFNIEILTIHPQWVTALLDEATVSAE